MAEGGVSSAEVPPDGAVWRRIPPRYFPTEKGRTTPHSPAFDDNNDGPMSVVIARDGRSALEILEGHEGFGVVELRIKDLVEMGLSVVPLPVPGEPDHAHVLGKKTGGRRRAMARCCRWLHPDPPPVGEG